MSKVITSPSKVWPGTVTLSDPLTLPQVAAFDRAVRQSRELDSPEVQAYYRAVRQARANETEEPAMPDSGHSTLSEYYATMMPGVYACVEHWDLKNFDAPSPDLFPGQPRDASGELAAWLINEVSRLLKEAEEPAPKA